jgi:hypothetical protein
VARGYWCTAQTTPVVEGHGGVSDDSIHEFFGTQPTTGASSS